MLALLGLGGGNIARAQEAPEAHEPPPEALEFYASGRELYRQGRYQEAADELERALALDPASPVLTYNLARVYELLGELERALRFYERYVALIPEEPSEDRGRAEESIARVQGAIATASSQQEAQDEDPPPPPQPRTETRRGVADLPFWIAAASGAVLLAGGTLLGALALGAEDDARGFVIGADGSWQAQASLAERADGLALGADLLFGLGAAGLITAGLLFALRTRRVPIELTASMRPDGAFLLGLRGAL